MPQQIEYLQGTPNWVELKTNDQDAAKEFYGSLFGWSFDDQLIPQDGVYSMATLRGEAVAAIAPIPEGASDAMPPRWVTCIAVDDVNATSEKVAPAGGRVVTEAFGVGDAGRMAWVADPTGAVVGLWQAGRHIGATLVNEPGALFWNELLTDKPDMAIAFYETVLGVSHVSVDAAPSTKYYSLKVAGHDVAGCVEPAARDTPNHWHNYFTVEDTDATARQVVAAGGRIAVDSFDIPWAHLLKRDVGTVVGRAAVLADPQGGLFGVMTMPAQ
jgi:predicted enzyme related to lactoylglutathione lyase